MKPIFLDYNSTTPLDPLVFESMKPYFLEEFGNPSSENHLYGTKAKKAVEHSRKIIADFINCHSSEIVFTSGSTESINSVIKGVGLTTFNKQNHIITVTSEHKAVLEVCEYVQSRDQEVTYLKVDREGHINLQELEQSIKRNTVLVVIMHGNNEIGTVHPIEKIGGICKEKNVPLFVDCAQTFGKLEIDVKKYNIDFLSASAHKIYGPKGIGLLYSNSSKGYRIPPLIHGGGQEGGQRSGTLNVPAIVGFGKATELASENFSTEIRRIEHLSSLFIEQLDSANIDYLINGSTTNRIPGNLNICFPEIDSDWLMIKLDNIAIATGSACTTQTLQPSHVLRAIGLTDEKINNTVRISFGRFTTEEEILYVANEIIRVLPMYKELKQKIFA